MLREICFPILSSFPSAQGVSCVCDSLEALIGARQCMCKSHRRLWKRQACALLGVSSAQQETTAILAAQKQARPHLSLAFKDWWKSQTLPTVDWNYAPLALSQHRPAIWHAYRLQWLGTVTICENNSFKDFLWFLKSNYTGPLLLSSSSRSGLPQPCEKSSSSHREYKKGASRETTTPCGLPLLLSLKKNKDKDSEFWKQRLKL